MTLAEAPTLVDRRTRVWAHRQIAYVATAALLVLPCVWLPDIQASDLGSHLYNAWLSNRAAAGELPGLYLVPQYTNVLFDILLSWLLKSFGAVAAERIGVIAAVEIFFWGCFALVSAVRGRAAWARAPMLVLLTFGAVFRMGFFNFYISVGICCLAIALIWSGVRRWLAIPLLLVAATAHFLPCLWAALAIAYVLTARRLSPAQRWWLLTGGLIAIGGLAALIAARLPSVWVHGVRIESFFGADQVLTFGAKYNILAAALLCWFVIFLVRRLESDDRPWADPVFHLWILLGAATILLPDTIWMPWYTGGLAYIGLRLSLLSAILLCAAVARVASKPVETAGLTLLLVIFLSFSYVDERQLNHVEQEMSDAIATLPPSARVISAVKDSRLYIPALEHVAARLCIGRCFDFADYEPTTAQFRLRARPGNSFTLTELSDIDNLEHHQLAFRGAPVAVYRLSYCPNQPKICVDRLSAGQQVVKEDIPQNQSLRLMGSRRGPTKTSASVPQLMTNKIGQPAGR